MNKFNGIFYDDDMPTHGAIPMVNQEGEDGGLPEPVAPTTSNRPRFLLIKSAAIEGKPSCCIGGISTTI